MSTDPLKPGDKIRRIDPSSQSHHAIGFIVAVDGDHAKVVWNNNGRATKIALKREGIGWERATT